MNNEKKVSVGKLAALMDLQLICDSDADLRRRMITTSDVNRPALQIAGYMDYFDVYRVEIIGIVEAEYFRQLPEDIKRERMEALMCHKEIPCFIYARGIQPDPITIEYAQKYGIPLFSTTRVTSEFVAELISCLRRQLAPCVSIHGVLVDVYGVGVMITGESGIGKSEAALELVRRGHRLVTDDVVEIRKHGDNLLFGTSPEITRHFIELRGIGIIDVKMLYGVESVEMEKKIDLVINLEEWKKDGEYDRVGMEENYTEFLGSKIPCHHLPIRPGRNLAIIVEAAAVNHRQKKMGYNAAQELYRRVQSNLTRSNTDELLGETL